MLLKELIAFLSNLFAGSFVEKEAPQLRKKFFFSGYLDGSSSLRQTLGDFQEIKHMGTEEDTLSKEQRLERVMTPYPDKTPSHEDQCPEAIEPHQFAHRIEENHLGALLIGLARVC
jgi:isopenicillin N synthase-like dioxygenase